MQRDKAIWQLTFDFFSMYVEQQAFQTNAMFFKNLYFFTRRATEPKEILAKKLDEGYLPDQP